MELLETLKKCPLIAVLRGISPSDVVAIGEVLIKTGFVCLEVPLNSPDNPLTSIAMLVERFGDKALIGAGTVTTVEQISAVQARGGRLIIMPHTNPRLITAAKAERLYCIPGFSTPSEAFMAIEAGADALKLFPTPIPAILKAMKAILPAHIPILPVGGINPESMSHYLQAGASGFGLGSNLYGAGDSPEIVAQRARVFYATIRSLS